MDEDPFLALLDLKPQKVIVLSHHTHLKFPGRDNDFLLAQIYVDDIIFGGSSHALVSSFSENMSREFEMSMMGELNYFLGLQIKQCKEGIFIHQTKYTKDLLKRFDMGDCKPIATPMATSTVLDPDEEGEAVDQRAYRGMIDSEQLRTAYRAAGIDEHSNQMSCHGCGVRSAIRS